MKCDLTNRNEIYEVADKVKQEVGDVDILINNAGYVSGKSFLEIRYRTIFIFIITILIQPHL